MSRDNLRIWTDEEKNPETKLPTKWSKRNVSAEEFPKVYYKNTDVLMITNKNHAM